MVLDFKRNRFRKREQHGTLVFFSRDNGEHCLPGKEGKTFLAIIIAQRIRVGGGAAVGTEKDTRGKEN